MSEHPAADALLARFDSEMRRDAPPEAGFSIDRSNGIVRIIGPECWIVWWSFGAAATDSAVAAEAHAFRAAGRSVEWKVYGHDAPANVTATLQRYGFVPDEPETLMVLDLHGASDAMPTAAPLGCDVRRVLDERGLADLVAVTSEAFGVDASWMMDTLPQRLFVEGARAAAYVAYVAGRPVGGGRLECPIGRSFASIWGGATIEGFRRRGIFASLVAARAAHARDAGHAYLTVDARESSRAILERLGFALLTTVRGWNLTLEANGDAGDATATSPIAGESEHV